MSYQDSYEKGVEYQDYIVKQLYQVGIPLVCFTSRKYQREGENIAGFEIKFDDRMRETGNVYFETAEKTDAGNKDFMASGIFRNDNTWLYVIGDYDTVYICGKAHLRHVYEREREKEESFARFTGTETSQGMLLPQKYVEEQLAVKTLKIKPKSPWKEGVRPMG